MCNRSIKIEDMKIMNGHAWDLKEFSIIGSIGDGMSLKEHIKKENKEV